MAAFLLQQWHWVVTAETIWYRVKYLLAISLQQSFPTPVLHMMEEFLLCLPPSAYCTKKEPLRLYLGFESNSQNSGASTHLIPSKAIVFGDSCRQIKVLIHAKKSPGNQHRLAGARTHHADSMQTFQINSLLTVVTVNICWVITMCQAFFNVFSCANSFSVHHSPPQGFSAPALVTVGHIGWVSLW